MSALVQRLRLAVRGSRPPMVDFFSRAGGSSMGYHRAGFELVCVDKDPQPHNPFTFVQADAMELVSDTMFLSLFRAVAGSPPCQLYTLCQRIQGNDHPDLVGPFRAAARASGLPYVIENVEGAPLIEPVMLCGAMFPSLRTYRHRLFEGSFPIEVPEHPEHLVKNTKMGRSPRPGEFMHVVGNFAGVAQARVAMGIDWMTRDELREAIPPAYTELIGTQLMAVVRARGEVRWEQPDLLGELAM